MKWDRIGIQWKKWGVRPISKPVDCMFIGEYAHTLDDKKRISLPKAYRAQLGDSVVVTKGLDNSLVLYSRSLWERIAEKMQQLSFTQADARAFSRLVLSGSVEVEIDKVGRIHLPELHRAYAGLTRDVIFIGVSDRVEIWDAESWVKYRTTLEKSANELAEKLGHIDFL
jgi:MraZ protein